jgi:hypothetical protein
MAEIQPDKNFDTKTYTTLKDKKLQNIDYGSMSGIQGMTAEKIKAIALARIDAEATQREKDMQDAAAVLKKASLDTMKTTQSLLE